MKQKNIIEYQSYTKAYDKIFVPSKTIIPQWFKDIPKWLGKDGNHRKDIPAASLKACVPFLDAMSAGYMVRLPCDIIVSKDINNTINISWKTTEESPVGYLLNESVKSIPAPKGYHKEAFYWIIPVSFVVPVGNSMLAIHPINRYDVPFLTLGAFIDGGFVGVPGAHVSFFLHEDFEGIIPQGTPIMQIIPIKNNNWEMLENNKLYIEAEKNSKKSSAVFSGWYKKTWWTQKKFD